MNSFDDKLADNLLGAFIKNCGLLLPPFHIPSYESLLAPAFALTLNMQVDRYTNKYLQTATQLILDSFY